MAVVEFEPQNPASSYPTSSPLMNAKNWNSSTRVAARWVTDPMSSPPLSPISLLPTLPTSSFLLYPSEVVLQQNFIISQDSSCESDVFELLVKPVRLVRDNELLDHEFVNIMHALQVVHFYCWKGSALLNKMSNIDSKVLKVTEVISGLNSVLLNDNDFASKVFCNMPSEEKGCIRFDWSEVLAAVASWEDYASNLSKQIHLQLPHWRMHESINNVQLEGVVFVINNSKKKEPPTNFAWVKNLEKSTGETTKK